MRKNLLFDNIKRNVLYEKTYYLYKEIKYFI